MANIFGYSGYSSLFRTSAMSSFYSNLGQYASLRSGAYRKAAKAYYSKAVHSKAVNASSTVKGKDSQNDWFSQNVTSKTNPTSVAISNTKTEASELVDAAKKLTSTGKDSLFADKEKYDKDAVYTAVNNFVSKYNDTVKALNATGNATVRTAGNSMTRMTNTMSNSLSQVGITVGSDGKLSLDEETFKNADMNKVKSLFNGNSSYAGIVSSSASRIVSQANNQLTAFPSATYGSSGSYYNSYASGMMYNGFF